MATATLLRAQSYTSGPSPSQTLNYAVNDTTNAQDAATAVQAAAPPTIPGNDGTLYLYQITVDSSDDDEWAWTGTAEYQREGINNEPPKDYPETGYEEISFDIATANSHITQSLNTQEDPDVTRKYPRTGLVEADVKDHKGSIGVDKDKVTGTDILVPSLSFTVTLYADATLVEATDYIKNVASAAGTTNDATFRGFEKGEVIFLGASGSKRSNVDYTMAFRFAANANVTGFTIGEVTGIDKEGWEYLWIEYEEKKEGKFTTKRARCAYVERVYEETNFPAVLGISP